MNNRNRRNQYAQDLGASIIGSAIGLGARGAYRTLTNPPPARNQATIKKKGKFIRKKKTLKTQVKEIKSVLDADNATHTNKRYSTTRLFGSENQANYGYMIGYTNSVMESSLNSLRYYDPSVPGTLVTASGSTGTYARNFLFDSIYTKTSVRNNYVTPCIVSIYACTPKEDTDILPQNAMTNGLADQGNPSSSSILIYPTDSDQFKDLWRIEKSITKKLSPGGECSLSVSRNKIRYDPSLYDSHGLTYQKGVKSVVFLYRVQGVLGHDSSVTTQQGTLAGAIDMSTTTKFVIKYDAGVNLNDISLADSNTSFTNAPQVTQYDTAQEQFGL